jgi:GNAT superfamily N-acetyltransferase
MNKLEYIYDDKETYDQQILDGLKAYNLSQTGDRHRERNVIYVFQDDILVGGTNATMAWDWIHLNELFYDNEDILRTMLNHTYKVFHQEAVGVMKDMFHPEIIKLFISLGFITEAIIPNIPNGYTFHTLVNRQMTPYSIESKYTVVIKPDVVTEYKDDYKAKYHAFMEKHGDSDKHPTFTYACLDGDKVVGGVVCSFSYDNIYVDLLWVDDPYRGHSIGTTLMKKAEEEAKKHNIRQIFLGTCSFQAPQFYKTLGYQQVGASKDFPKGFVNYTFCKKLK